MSEKHLNLTAMSNAISRLQEGIKRYELDTSDSQIRDGLIQRFEFTYEITHKMLKRYLELSSANPDGIDALTFQDLIRSGNEQGLLRTDWPSWKIFRDMRSKTSHTYDEAIALEVVSQIPSFLLEAKHLYSHLQQRQA